ncbi:hypothetical protein FQN60_004116 [Etheostoma spectabile]|uniref:Uncharacterized protein n=1 Tax=Etheostoma spectabile TaxID=54343 RepID=A0A5J5CSV6_9PERO|nr:hypothetical protein FQN60_004116 [Etheostoma spectabile]
MMKAVATYRLTEKGRRSVLQWASGALLKRYVDSPSPGGHSWQHSPLVVYWPESQGSCTARSVLDANANATWDSDKGEDSCP